MRILSRAYTNEQQRVARREDTTVGGANQATKSDAQSAIKAGDVKVSVSSEAKAMAARDEMNMQRVSALKTSIDAGTFKINPPQIAEALLGD
jgi:flagellar biosynthesis anti-sigma factor FlgM